MYTVDSATFNVPLIVNTTYATYNMEPVLLVILGGLEQRVQIVIYLYIIINMHNNKPGEKKNIYFYFVE